MSKSILVTALAAWVATGAAGPAHATGARPAFDPYQAMTRTAWGGFLDASWSTALVAGGDQQYFAPMPRHSGVAALIMDHAPQRPASCRLDLSSDRASIPAGTGCASESVDAR